MWWRSNVGERARRRLRPEAEGTDEVRYNLSALYDKYGKELQAFYGKEVNNPELDKDNAASAELDDAVRRLLKSQWRKAAHWTFRWEKRGAWAGMGAGAGTLFTGLFKDTAIGFPVFTLGGGFAILGAIGGLVAINLKIHGLVADQYAGNWWRRETLQPQARDQKQVYDKAESNIKEILSGSSRPDDFQKILHSLHALHAS